MKIRNIFFKLFSNKCEQHGDDHEGLAGFLEEDILKAAKECKKTRCCYCKLIGANIKCSNRKCKNNFHTHCALQDDALFQFHNTFPIICSDHIKKPAKDKKKLESTCHICFDRLDKAKSILIPCCKNSYFHRLCLQKYAHTSGSYHFKCPLCADREVCINELPKMGIYIPMKDAEWELDDDFQDMAAPPVLLCENCDNKDKDADKPYLWKLCGTCGSQGIHYECDTEAENPYTCQECTEIHENFMKSKAMKRAAEKMERATKKKKNCVKPSPFLLCSDEELCSTDDDDDCEEGPAQKKTKYQHVATTDRRTRSFVDLDSE